MLAEDDHQGRVAAWIAPASELPCPELVALFERAMGSLWLRARKPLGGVTLAAIADRVLFTAMEHYAFLSTLSIDEEEGLEFAAFREGVEDIPPRELLAAIRFVVTEFIQVLGILTSEILSSALHEELELVAPTHPSQSEKSSRAPRNGEDS